MELPIYIDGKRTGTVTLTEREDGASVSASLEDPGRVVRLYLFGETTAYLGVPEPAAGMLRLERRLSAADRALLPKRPAYAAEGPAGEKTPRRHVLWHGGKPHYF